ncbi:cell division protein FtsQ/DivIB [Trichococcus collinsii]|uniref:Cell division protein DivIB n=1 Tax=Trichococcus collinsii TaxID=157076 RepID=A0AB37ZVL6_9LACT|nr:cell division protein FtsQ/DivIB [Trichococcus collinsii]CZQ86037.1 polypeptide-transport-associated ftsq-type [Trichococcus collinsii]SDZ77572.1 cell division protein FtsQ [Trichococcus collinsii]
MIFGKIRQKLSSKSSSELTPWQRVTAESEKKNKAQLKQKITINGRMHRLIKEKKEKLNSRKHPPETTNTDKRQGYLGWYSIFLIGVIGSSFLISPYGKVKDIYVEGAEDVPEQSIIDASHITGKLTALGVVWNDEKIDAYITNTLPVVKTAEVTLRGLNDVTIHVTEHETIAYVYSGGSYYNVLENGTVADTELKVPIGNNPIITSFEMNQNLEDLLEQYMQLTDSVQNSISEIKYTGTEENPYAITVYMNDGNEVKAILPSFAEKILYYPDIVSQLGETKGTIDLEVGVYFTPFAQTTEEEAAASEDSVTPVE